MGQRRFRLPRSGLIPSALLMLLVVTCLLPALAGEGPGDKEVRLGRSAQRDFEETAKLCTDKALNERVSRLGQSIAAVANSTRVAASYGDSDIVPFKYEFKVVEDKSVNAFSLPGGFIYVNTGLLDYVESDHELAAVLAHEVAHSSHHHMLHLMRQQSKMDSNIALLLLAGMLARVDGEGLGNLLIGAQLLRTARSSGYGQKAEVDADVSAVTYMSGAGYNPVGMLTFLERLARDATRSPDIDLGILQTHPAPKSRCKYVLARIESQGLPINRRAVTHALTAEPNPVTIKGQSISQVRLGNIVLFEPAPIGNAVSSEQRAQVIVTKLNQLLDSEPALRDVTLGGDHRSVLVKGEPVIVVTAQDGTLYDKPVDRVALDIVDTLRNVIWRDTVGRLY